MNAKRHAEAVTFMKELCDKGMVVEGGWQALKATWLDPDMPPDQVKVLRYAYMAGAQHLFSCLIVQDSDRDMIQRRLQSVAAELDAFVAEMQMQMPTEGSA